MKPGRLLFITALLYMLLACGAFFSDALFLVWFLTGLGLAPLIAADLLLLVFFTDRPGAERELPVSLAQGESTRVKLVIRRGDRPLLPAFISLYDLYPDSMKADIFPATPDRRPLKKSGALVFEYTLLPLERGPWVFPGLDLLLDSPLRFWRLRVTRRVESRGRTYPDFKRFAGGSELRGFLDRGGIREIRRRGQGTEFENLRDYEEGDSIRLVDWRATSRSRRPEGGYRLVVRNYQEERDQQVLFIIDSGYRLPGPQFDSALNAALLLSYVALKHGDGVGAATFGPEERWIPPRKGSGTFTGLMNALYDLHSTSAPSSPLSALEKALGRLHRRSFIVLVSSFREEDGESLAWILPRLERRHLLLLVSFRESEAEALAFSARTGAAPAADSTPSGARAETVLERAAAFSYLAARRRLYRKWEHEGILILETSPEHISSALINRYLEVKRSGRL